MHVGIPAYPFQSSDGEVGVSIVQAVESHLLDDLVVGFGYNVCFRG